MLNLSFYTAIHPDKEYRKAPQALISSQKPVY